MKKSKKTGSRIVGFLLAACMGITQMPNLSTVLASGETAVQEEIQAQLYVSVDGSDSQGDGSMDKPFATVGRAQEEVRKLNDNMTGDIVVYIGAGDYYLDSTIEMDERDSGTNGYQVIYKNWDALASAHLIGGEKIEGGWEVTTEADVAYDLAPELVGKVYKLQLDPEEYNFNCLYINDEKAVMARTKNYQYDSRFESQRGEYMYAAGGGYNYLNYKEGDLSERDIVGMQNAQARGEVIAQLYVWDGGVDWYTDTLEIGSIDTGSRTLQGIVDPERPEYNRVKFDIASGSRYFLQGNLAFMDVPGEWHYNKSTGVLYYYPKEGEEDLAEQKIVIPTMEEVIRIQGSDKLEIEDYGNEPDLTKQASNIVISGLAVECTDFSDWFTSGWAYTNWLGATGIGKWPEEAAGSTNPSYCETSDRPEFQKAGIKLTNTNHITIENCIINNIGFWGIYLQRDNTYNTIRNCEIKNVGYGGIGSDGGYPAIGKYNNHHTITNILIHDIGTNVGHASGISLQSTGQTNVSHIEVYNSPRRGFLLIGGIVVINSADANYDEMEDYYSVGNRFEYMYIHDCQQDSGEDTAVHFTSNRRGDKLIEEYGTNDPREIINPETGEPWGDAATNVLNQVLIDNTGATPSMHDKNTSHGLDLAMGNTGTYISNVKSVNNASRTMRIDPWEVNEAFYTDNLFNNFSNDLEIENFDESKMEYDKIGLTDEFPFARETVTVEKPDDIYFEEDFENGKIDIRKWTVEKGEASVTKEYMSEGILNGMYSLATDGNKNAGTGVVVSREFENALNKIVEVKYFDKRQDYAGSDAGQGGRSFNLKRNGFVRVDNGDVETQVAIGVDSEKSKDYFYYKNGEELIQTEVPRSFGWHTFKFDYSKKGEVTLYIDDIKIATLERESFNYLGMGDWEGIGGELFFDEIYIYGGVEAPPVEELPLPKPPAQPEENAYENDFEDIEISTGEDEKNPLDYWVGGGTQEVSKSITADPDDEDNSVMYVECPDGWILLDYPGASEWTDYTFECKLKIADWGGKSDGLQSWDNVGPGLYYGGSTGSANQPMRYTLKFKREGGFAAYRRTESDTDLAIKTSAEAGITETNTDHTGQWYQVKIVAADGNVKMYIDNQLVFDIDDSNVAAGSIGIDGVNGKFYVDDVKVTENNEATELFAEDFETSASEPSEPTDPIPEWEFKGIGSGGTPKKSVIVDPEDSENQVMYVNSPWATLMLNYGDSSSWSTYTFEADVKLADWGGNSQGLLAWDNFAPAVYCAGNTGDSGQPNRYALKFNRTGGFAAYRRNSADSDLETKTAEEAGITETNPDHTGQWYHVKMVAENGNIKMYIDDILVFNVEDSAITSGSIGFDGINANYYVDNVKVVRGVTAAPTVDKEEGEYTGVVEVNLSAESGAQIFYTLDGTDPRDAEHGIYYISGEPITIDKTTTLKFVAIASGTLYSDVVTKTYTIVAPAVDKSELEALISSQIGRDLSQYTEASVKVYEEALANAKAVLADDTVTDQSLVDAAIEQLENAIEGLEFKEEPVNADKSKLDELIKKADALDLTQYTEESVNVLKTALAAAKSVMADESLTSEDQAKVDEAAKALDEAIKGLVKETSDDNNGDTGNGDNNNGNHQGDNAGNGNGNNTNGKDDGKSDTPKTGDMTNIMIWLTVMLAALGSVYFIVKKRFKGI